MSISPAALVLSPTPPRPESRSFFLSRFGPDVSFLDLPALRRTSLGSSLASLRRRRVDSVVVTGAPDELRLLLDYLVVLAFVVPRASRMRQLAGEEPAPLGAAQLIRSGFRIAAGLVAGAFSLARAWMRARRVAGEHPLAAHPSRALVVRAGRCLYLKPMLSFGASVGGSVAHVAGVVNAMDRAGVAVRLLSAHQQPLVAESVTQEVVPPASLMSFPFEVNQYRYQGAFLRAARRRARADAPDLIYQRYAVNDLTGVLLRRELGLPLVLEFNGSEVWAQRHWGEPLRFERLSEAIERENLRHADLVVVVSQALVDQAISLGAAPERVLFYPNGIDPLVFDPARFSARDRTQTREALGVRTDAMLLTFVGTFGRWHGTDVLATVIRRLIDEERSWLERHRVHFLFVGDGALAPTVRSTLGDDLGAPFATLAGIRPQDQTPRILAASDVLLSPHVPNPDGTPFFGSPTKLFEYMAMAKPIVASDLDQIGWVLKGWRPGQPPAAVAGVASRAALLVEPGSAESLLTGIRRAVELPPADREALGLEARRLALESFTWDKNVEAVLARLRAGGPPPVAASS
jgi:glycosyltransferase involved in cell wall biosynthesis